MIALPFLLHHGLDIFLLLVAFFAVTAKVIPPQYAGLSKEFFDVNQQKMIKHEKQSLVEAISTGLFFTPLKSLLVYIGFRGATTLIMFAVIGVDLIYRKTISDNAVIIAIVGILALHFEQLLDKAEEVSVWRIFTYKQKK